MLAIISDNILLKCILYNLPGLTIFNIDEVFHHLPMARGVHEEATVHRSFAGINTRVWCIRLTYTICG
jgi:hypothetical protein